MIRIMTKISIGTVLFTVLLGAGRVHALNQLKDINIQKAGDSVVVIVTTSEPCQYNPFLTNTKPERIVVDLTGVVNSWSTKKFMSLPLKSIAAVRSSQFTTEPDLVTRVVLDVGRPVDFRSFQNGNDIVIKLPAVAGESDFAEWSARNARPVPVKKAAAKPPEQPKKTAAAPKKIAGGVALESYPKRKIVNYNTGSYRDPFEPLVGGPGGQLGKGLPVLENLALVGILEDEEGNRRALLEDAEGNGYIMLPRDRVKNGYLVSVSDTKAIFQVTEYGWTRTVALELELTELK